MIPIATIVLLAQAGRGGGFDAVFMLIMMSVGLALSVAAIAGMWLTFTKAGQPGWAAIIPIYNWIVMLEIADKPIWWILLFFIPCANLIVQILVCVGIAEKFGEGVGFGLGLAFLGFIFFPILGFGSYQYEGRRGRRRRPEVYDDDEYE